jgi:hypothetical protein
MRFLIIVVLSLLAGCGTTGSIQANLAPVEGTNFILVDGRSVDQRTGSKFKESSGTDVSIFGDDLITPPPPVLVKSWLHHQGSRAIAGRTLYLRQFEVRVEEPPVAVDEARFSQAASSTPGAGFLGVLLARAVVGSIEIVRGDKNVLLSIEGALDQWPFKVRSGGSFKGRVTESDVMSVINSALAETKVELERQVARETGLAGQIHVGAEQIVPREAPQAVRP